MKKSKYIPEYVQALIDIAERTGGDAHNLDPIIVVEEARNPKHPLHHAADWRWNDDAGAAMEYRIELARSLIRSIPESPISSGTYEQMVPAWVRDTRLPHNQRGYVQVAEVQPNSEFARNIVLSELRLALANLRRALAIADRLGMRSALEALVRSAEEVYAQIETMPLSPDAPKKRGRRAGKEKRV